MATSPKHRPGRPSAPERHGSDDPPVPGPPPSLPVRLELWHEPHGEERTEGAWWPRSRDLHAEAAHLVDSFPVVHGRVTRLLFSRPDWDHSTHDGRSAWTIHGARGPVLIGSFPSDDTQLMIVTTGHGRRLILLVIPSDTPPIEAHRQLHERSHTHSPPATTRSDANDWARWDTESPSW